MKIGDDGYDEYRRDIVNKSQRKRRENARKNGLCCICCVREPRVGFKTCEECSARARAYNKANYVPKKGKPGRPRKTP